MSTFENSDYHWRETYFILFESSRRPTQEQVAQALRGLGKRYELTNERSEDDGLFGSLTVVSHDDFAALDVSYLDGEEVNELVEQMIAELKPVAKTEAEKARLKRLARCDARFDVLHFEHILAEGDPDDADDDLLDPTALLIVMETLTKLCDGLAIDPQSGAFS
ncbi:MAG: hypothetical protein U0836_11525 [Pirellulales bacterium]